MSQIDWEAVFQNLPQITGIPLTLHGRKYYGACYLDGSKSDRWDKIVFRQVNDGIQVMEQGGDAMTLWNWMLRFGGCGDVGQVKERLIGLHKVEMMYDDGPVFRENKHVPWSIFQEQSRLVGHTQDPLFSFLLTHYDPKKVIAAYRKYNVTPAICRDGSIGTQFWYVNSKREICGDKIMFYNSDGHRDKSINPKNRFKYRNGYTDRCFFGEHRTVGKTESIKVVESEKTALICYLEYGGCWVASGGLKGLGLLDRIRDKRVYLVPDMDGAQEWARYGKVWKWWEKCEGVESKWDIADYIIKSHEKSL